MMKESPFLSEQSLHHNLSYTSKQAKNNELFIFLSKDTPITFFFFFSGGNFRPYELDCASAFLKQHDVCSDVCAKALISPYQGRKSSVCMQHVFPRQPCNL